MEDNSKIGQYFKDQFAEHTEEVSLQEIELMAQRMTVPNFTSFSFTTFNIYYAAAIFSGFLISLCLGTHYLTTYRAQSELLKQNQQELIRLKELMSQNVNDSNLKTMRKQADKTEPSYESLNSSNQPKNSNYLLQKEKSPKQTAAGSTPFENKIAEKKGTVTTVKFADENKTNEVKNIQDLQVVTPPTTTFEPESKKSVVVALPQKDTVSSMPTFVRPKVVIYKRDTIYEFDTLKVKKRRKKL